MIEQIRPRELATWLSRHHGRNTPVVLDVREPAEWRTASVKPGAFTLLNMSMGSVPARLHELDPHTPIACLCHHGGRSMQVAQFLAADPAGQLEPVGQGCVGIASRGPRLVPAVTRPEVAGQRAVGLQHRVEQEGVRPVEAGELQSMA